MKLADLYESNGNQYFEVTDSVKVWVSKGHQPSNHYYGTARIHKAVYEPYMLEDTDEIHVLHGGTFFVIVENGGHKVLEGVLIEPTDRSPFEKNHGGWMSPVPGRLKELLAQGKIAKLADGEQAKVTYR